MSPNPIELVKRGTRDVDTWRIGHGGHSKKVPASQGWRPQKEPSLSDTLIVDPPGSRMRRK